MSSRPPGRGLGARLAAVARSSRIWLAVLVFAFIIASTVAGVAAYQDLSHRLGGGNLGIFMQALSSSSHGNIPFYEAPDCAAKDRCSFLLVHPGFVLTPLIPIYAAWPSATTLFVVQSIGVGLAALPLYWLTRQVTGSSAKGLVAAGLYLVWAPLLAGEAFSFGLESFLPLALFTTAALWQAREYAFGFVAAGISFITFEIVPIFVALIALFFLYPAARDAAGAAVQRFRDWRVGRLGLGQAVIAWTRALRALLNRADVRATLGLLAAAAVAFLVLQWFMNVGGAQILGAPIPKFDYGWSSLFYDNSGSQQNGVPLSTVLHSPSILFTSPQTVTTLEYWGILFGLVAFIPFLAPRTWIIILPWVGYSFLSLNFRFATIGLAADSISAVPVFIGVAYGLKRFDLGTLASTRRGASAPTDPTIPSNGVIRRGTWRSRPSAGLCWTLLGAAILANLLLSSIAPPTPGLTISGQGPFRGDYYFAPVMNNSGVNAVESMLAGLPPDEFIGVPTELFPLVANDPNAFIVTPTVALKELPFNTSAGPSALLVDGFGNNLPSSLLKSVGNPRLFGVAGYVESTAVGPVLLYERAFNAEPQGFGASTTATADQFTAQSGLSGSTDGSALPVQGAPGGTAICSQSGLKKGGAIGHTADQFLYPVNYTVELFLQVNSVNGTSSPSTTVVQVGIQGFAGFSVTHNFTVSSIAMGHWTTVKFTITSDSPELWVDAVARLLDVRYSVELGSLTFVPISD
jgi:uncharacterized membrane protein